MTHSLGPNLRPGSRPVRSSSRTFAGFISHNRASRSTVSTSASARSWGRGSVPRAASRAATRASRAATRIERATSVIVRLPRPCLTYPSSFSVSISSMRFWSRPIAACSAWSSPRSHRIAPKQTRVRDRAKVRKLFSDRARGRRGDIEGRDTNRGSYGGYLGGPTGDTQGISRVPPGIRRHPNNWTLEPGARLRGGSSSSSCSSRWPADAPGGRGGRAAPAPGGGGRARLAQARGGVCRYRREASGGWC
jgi:hypothetical protein